MTNKMATILVKLITLPNRRTANASVRESSEMMLNGNMKGLGRR